MKAPNIGMGVFKNKNGFWSQILTLPPGSQKVLSEIHTRICILISQKLYPLGMPRKRISRTFAVHKTVLDW